MTREEAIKELTELLPEEFLSEYTDAIKMAIKALESESRMKYVQETVNTIMNACDTDSIADKAMRNAAKFVQNAIDGSYPDFEKLEQEPCDDAISRQAVLKAIDIKAWEFCDYLISNGRNDEQKPVSHFADNLRECVGEDLPPVTPQPKMGYWEWVQYDSNPTIGNWHCSECRTIIPDMPEETYNTPIYKWCPMCGCKMQEVE